MASEDICISFLELELYFHHCFNRRVHLHVHVPSPFPFHVHPQSRFLPVHAPSHLIPSSSLLSSWGLSRIHLLLLETSHHSPTIRFFPNSFQAHAYRCPLSRYSWRSRQRRCEVPLTASVVPKASCSHLRTCIRSHLLIVVENSIEIVFEAPAPVSSRSSH